MTALVQVVGDDAGVEGPVARKRMAAHKNSWVVHWSFADQTLLGHSWRETCNSLEQDHLVVAAREPVLIGARNRCCR